MNIRLAGPEDLGSVARLVWLHSSPDERAHPVESFAEELGAWWTDQGSSHVAFVACLATDEVVGVAWVTLVPRVPRPGNTHRRSADIQSVFVMPEHRGMGIGSALIRAATDHAKHVGAARITVHSSRRAVPVYERLAFASSRQLLQSPAD